MTNKKAVLVSNTVYSTLSEWVITSHVIHNDLKHKSLKAYDTRADTDIEWAGMCPQPQIQWFSAPNTYNLYAENCFA